MTASMPGLVEAPSKSSPWPTFTMAAGAAFLVALDGTMAVAAFPALRASFPHVTPAGLSWVLNAYTILYAALLVPAGRLVDLLSSTALPSDSRCHEST